MGDWLIGPIIDWLTGFVENAINTLWALLASTILTTPDVTALPQVQAITARSVVIVDVVYVLAVIAAGIAVMARESLQARYGLGELAPRLVIGFVAANFATPIVSEAITVVNALTRALTGDTITATGSFTQLRRIVTAALGDDTQALLTVIIVLVIAVLVASLLILWIMRLVTLILLAGIGPLALACHGLPWTQAAAALWWRTLLACLATVTAQALALHTGLSILLNPTANLPALGLPHEPSATFNLFIVLCLLWMTVRIPGLVRRYVTGGNRQRSALGSILRFVILQQLTRGLATRVRGFATGARRSPVGVRGPGGPAGPRGPNGLGGRDGPMRPTGPRGPRPGPTAPGSTAPGSTGQRSAAPSPQTTGATQPGGSGARWRTGTGWPTGPHTRARRTPGAAPSGTGWPAPPASRTGGTPGSIGSPRPNARPRPTTTRAVAGPAGAKRPLGAPVPPRGPQPGRTPARASVAPTRVPAPPGVNPYRAPMLARPAPTPPRSIGPRVVPSPGTVNGRGVRRGR
ncbi:MAG: hypothetical protein GXX79_11370 [Actinomycetales bacterium]|nr:hypothetical protein [Actinomycetales bacterium]